MNPSRVLSSAFQTSILILVLTSALAATPLQAQHLTICLEERANLDADTMKVFEEELLGIAQKSGFTLRLLTEPSECRDVRIRIQSRSSVELGALGATRVKDGRILPEIEIYSASVAKLIRSGLPSLVGRGMARVAAHELGHYLLQETTHSNGLMGECFSAAHLLVKDHRSFRLPMTVVALAGAAPRP